MREAQRAIVAAVFVWAGVSLAEGEGRLRVVAGVPPVGWLAEQIGGERVEVDVLVKSGQDPHLFEVSPRQATRLHRAAVFLGVGLPFEERVIEKLEGTAGGPRIVNLAAALAGECNGSEKRHAHGDHAHEGEDNHVWLSPPHLKLMAVEWCATLARLDAAHANEYVSRLQQFLARCDVVHAALQKQFADRHHGTFYVYHPAFGHFARSYGLRQKAVEHEGKPPGPRHLAALVSEARRDRVKILFVQPQFDPRSTDTIARAIGATVQTLDPLRPDVLDNLREIGAKILEALPAKTVNGNPSPEHP